jgi:hypothetical protein
VRIGVVAELSVEFSRQHFSASPFDSAHPYASPMNTATAVEMPMTSTGTRQSAVELLPTIESCPVLASARVVLRPTRGRLRTLGAGFTDKLAEIDTWLAAFRD